MSDGVGDRTQSIRSDEPVAQTCSKVLFDFSNIRNGGSLQVASATLHDLCEQNLVRQHSWLSECEIWISPALERNTTTALSRLPGVVRVVDTSPGIRSTLALWRPARRDFLLKFTLFGPTYLPRMAEFQICGFADGTLVNKHVTRGRSGSISNLVDKGRALIKRRAIRLEDQLVVETDRMAQLAHRWHGGSIRPVVIPNQPHPVFSIPIRREPWDPFAAAREGRVLRLLSPARLYPHKNLGYLAEVARALAFRGITVQFFVTLRPKEWEKFSSAGNPAIVNVGEQTPVEMNDLYEHTDAVFFPSLLETASATPLEALVKRLPLFASDRWFVRDQVGNAAWYFDPLDPESGAEAVCAAIANPALVSSRIRSGEKVIGQLLSAGSRTQQYLALVDSRLRFCSGGRC